MARSQNFFSSGIASNFGAYSGLLPLSDVELLFIEGSDDPAKKAIAIDRALRSRFADDPQTVEKLKAKLAERASWCARNITIHEPQSGQKIGLMYLNFDPLRKTALADALADDMDLFVSYSRHHETAHMRDVAVWRCELLEDDKLQGKDVDIPGPHADKLMSPYLQTFNGQESLRREALADAYGVLHAINECRPSFAQADRLVKALIEQRLHDYSSHRTERTLRGLRQNLPRIYRQICAVDRKEGALIADEKAITMTKQYRPKSLQMIGGMITDFMFKVQGKKHGVHRPVSKGSSIPHMPNG